MPLNFTDQTTASAGRTTPLLAPIQRFVVGLVAALRRRRLLLAHIVASCVAFLAFGLLGLLMVALLLAPAHWRQALWSRSQSALRGFLLMTCLTLVPSAAGDTSRPFTPASLASQSTSAMTPADSSLENMADLFTFANRSYGAQDPVRIVMVGGRADNTIVVTLPGQVISRMWSAVKLGLGMENAPEVAMTRRAIEDFRHQYHLPDGTTVILAGHSYGGMIAQIVASDPSPPDFPTHFKVAAVVTWGAPIIGGHAAGVAYYQYTSQYDLVPMLYVGELAPLALGGGLASSMIALLAMQASPALKIAFTGETYVPDMGHYASPADWMHLNNTWNDAHSAYGLSQWLAHQTITYSRDGQQLTLASIP